MTVQDTDDQLRRLSARVGVLERERTRRTVSDAYARFYAAMALGALVLLFLPILSDVVVKDDGSTMTQRYGTLWEMSDNTGGESAVLGILLVAGFVVLLAMASVQVRAPGHPISIAVTAFILFLMVVGKPGTGEPTPDLAAGGIAGAVLCVAAVGTAVVHAVHLHQRSRSVPPEPG
ncbi:MAG: hypothetical protein ACRDUA_07150 [Micromonosporaceae bacterium]